MDNHDLRPGAAVSVRAIVEQNRLGDCLPSDYVRVRIGNGSLDHVIDIPTAHLTHTRGPDDLALDAGDPIIETLRGPFGRAI
jgi:hypothetical protein